ncbi:Guanine nucleotide-binding protein-like 3 [Lunasporangiospora selenospora]|uniref:Guanine nucleotide-binding protein-like 3 n=1 Tax=Lunasporangiospora selenospora TaxID=979761 RepID=A0A9P6FQ57_9FUNG|nr:Guanine nucleotide-binding protein-like 3 [Lunasporangiospora selenospora]
MPRKKITSKRVAANHRYKIEKRVKDHHRKLKKEAKSNPNAHHRSKKDPGIPNNFPMKEEILQQIADDKQKAVEKKDRLRDAKIRAHEKELRRKKHEKLQKQREELQKMEIEGGTDKISTKSKLKRALEKKSKKNMAGPQQLKSVIDSSDVILMVLDARDPQRCRNKKMEEEIVAAGKRIILVLNKADLIPRDNVEGWLKALRKEYPTVVTVAVNSSDFSGTNQLVDHLKTFAAKKESITVGVVGYASVGRATLIQSLLETQELVDNKEKIRLLDVSGSLRGRGGPIEIWVRSKLMTNDELVSATAGFVVRCKKQKLMVTYSVPDYEGDGVEFLDQFARQRGDMLKGAVPNTVVAARAFLRDVSGGKMPFYTTPASASTASADVAKWIKEFGLDAKTDAKLLNSISFTIDRKAALILAPQDFEEEEEEEEEAMDVDSEEEEEDEEAPTLVSKKRSAKEPLKKQTSKKAKMAEEEDEDEDEDEEDGDAPYNFAEHFVAGEDDEEEEEDEEDEE